MSNLVFFLVIIACFVTMIAIIYALSRDIKQLKKENELWENKLAGARENVSQLSEFIRNSDKIRKEEKQIAGMIKEAKTDEEVHDIINNIIAINNSRVQNNQG